MKRIQFSMATLMGFVGLLAVGMAALKSANETWTAVITMLIMCLLLFAILAVFYTSGPLRRFWSGFALFGWAFLIVNSNWFMKQFGEVLTMHDLLRSIHARMEKVQPPPGNPHAITIWIKSDGSRVVDGEAVTSNGCHDRWAFGSMGFPST